MSEEWDTSIGCSHSIKDRFDRNKTRMKLIEDEYDITNNAVLGKLMDAWETLNEDDNK